MFNVAVQSLSRGVHITVLDSKLFARLFNDGCDLRVVGLYDPWEEVVGCLMVKSTGEDCPEPASCGIVLSCGDLHLCPVICEGACVCVCVCVCV